MTKTKQADAKIVASLEALKAELLSDNNPHVRAILFKINSCLFSEYPVKRVA